MREVLFRGKDIAGNWHYGDLINLTEELKQICNHNQLEHAHSVNPETVGQYTGLNDKNGNKIFEGDILKDVSDVENEQLYEVYYNTDLCAFMLDDQYWITPTRDWLSNDDKNPTTMMLQIVGNIHDNPELLKGGAE